MVNEKLIKAAHEDHHFFNSNPSRWAEIEIHNGEVKLHYGIIRVDGTRDYKWLTRTYSMEGDIVKFIDRGGGF